MKRGILQRHVRMGTASWRKARSSARKEEKDFNSRGSLTGRAVQTEGAGRGTKNAPSAFGKDRWELSSTGQEVFGGG